MANAEALFVGTSGFSYDEWRPAFYPDDLKKADMLTFYAERMSSVELNNTFYRTPRASTVEKWAQQVPDGFRFAVKAPKRFTWSLKLRDCRDSLDYLFEQLRPLGDRLGCVFFQVPKYVRGELDVIDAFLGDLPDAVRVAFEFAHDSWADPAIVARLHAAGATVVASDRDEDDEPVLHDDAPWRYLRLRRSGYDDEVLRRWRERVRGRDAFVFFKHEDSCAGPALARRFVELD